jgi:hypothetical protein
MAQVEILDVVRVPLSSQFFLNGLIDMPATGDCVERYGLMLIGWVLRHDAEPARLEVICEDHTVAKFSTDLHRPDVVRSVARPVTPKCGFAGMVNAATLPQRFELRLEVVGPGTRHHMATIYGRRSPLITDPRDEIQPLSVTTLGRTGSSLLMLLLSRHPEMVVHPPFPFETQVASYWTSVFEHMSSPNSYLRSLVTADEDGLWWTGHNPFPTETYLGLYLRDPGARWLGGRGLENLAEFARRQVLEFYRVSAAFQHKGGGCRYFVEKKLPLRRRQIQRELFPRSAEIFLVRDFRDVMASILAFNKKTGHLSFQQDRHGDEYVAFIRASIEQLWQAWQTAEEALLVRYEDLVRRTRPTLAEILGFLKLEATESVISQMITAAETVESEAQEHHRTTRDSLASVGRWRHDLPNELRESCNRAFAQVLSDFGYALE